MIQTIKRKRSTAAYIVSDSFSLLGNSAASILLPLVLLATTGNALAAGALALACAIPQIIAGVLGGAVLDRFNRRNVSVISDLISAAAVTALPIVDATVGLSFGWFVFFGILGAIGDVPGMTARDTLLPAVVKHDNLDLQRFMGVTQTIESIITIIGPAVAAVSLSALGATNALWFTAAMSAFAALTTLLIPRKVGTPPLDEEVESITHLARVAISSTKNGLSTLLKKDAVVSFCVLFSLTVVMVLGGWQSLIMPVYFTEAGRPDLTGYVLTALSCGMLAGSILYTVLATLFSRRAWYVLSIFGTAGGILIMGSLPAYPLLLAGTALLGFSAGPLTALLNYYMFDRIPDDSLGAAMGSLNSVMLVVGPVAVFATSVIVTVAGVHTAAALVAAAWIALAVFALAAKAMRNPQ